MIYFIQDTGVCNIKIGFTAADDADVRLKALQTGSPARLVLLATMPGTMDDEHALHERFAPARVHGEWFRPVPELLSFLFHALQEREYTLGLDNGIHLERDNQECRRARHPVIENSSWHGLLNDCQVSNTFSLQCPVCGFNCVHHSERIAHELGLRGPTRTLSFWGECGHCWTLAFGFHKGEMFMAALRDIGEELERAAEMETPFNPTEPTTARG